VRRRVIGIGLGGAPDARLLANVVTGHQATSPSDLPSGNVVVLDQTS
jgi:hypothetical protein